MIFRVKKEELKQQMSILRAMPFKADDFCPTDEELERMDAAVSDKDDPAWDKTRVLAFLLWVYATGYRTEDNAPLRENLRMYLKDHLRVFRNG